ncbi:MAG: glycosyltransferase [Candidatus Omnitrophica bacterium]|nr:glycosyltransferase [Candidatus Omnitrophota bacterium]
MDLIIIPFHDWRKAEKKGICDRDQHLIAHFRKDSRIEKILIVDRPISIPEMFVNKMPWRIKKGNVIEKGFCYCLTEIDKKTFVLDFLRGDVITPLFLKRNWLYFAFGDKSMAKAVKRAMRTISVTNPVVFLWNPFATGLAKRLDAELLVYDAMDNWLKHAEMKKSRKYLEKSYAYVSQNADIIFSVSEKMQGVFSGAKAGYKAVIKNGVDREFFSRGKREIPEDIKDIKKPIVGYAGRMGLRIDRELLEYLAGELPDLSFVFIGAYINKKWMKPLFRFSNLYFLGDKHYSELPSYLSCFDVCIIPHNVGRLENDGDPIKVYEYLAAGKPVVTTGITGMDALREVITVADTKQDFKNGILRLLEQIKKDPSLPARLRGYISEKHLWSAKAREMADTMLRAVSEGQGLFNDIKSRK